MRQLLRALAVCFLSSAVWGAAWADLCAGIIVNYAPVSESSSGLSGYASFDPSTGITTGFAAAAQNDFNLQPSAATSVNLNSGYGLEGAASSQATTAATFLPKSVTSSLSNSSSLRLSNTSADGSSGGSTHGNSAFSFTTSTPGIATLTWHSLWNAGSFTAGPDGNASTATYLQIFGGSSFAVLEGFAYYSGTDSGSGSFGFSTSSAWGGGDTITVDLQPGTYTVVAESNSSVSFSGIGSLQDFGSSGSGTFVFAPVPEPSTFVSASILCVMLTAGAAWRRFRQVAVGA